MRTDDDWEWYGREDPYFGVLADERFRGGLRTQALQDEFFASGEGDVARVLGVFGQQLAPLVTMDKALDFGCGVGRLAFPLARRFTSVVGVDVSASMLGEARRHAERMQIGTLRWCSSLAELSAESGSFSFVNTLIVLQHIAPEHGLAVIRQLIGLVASGGGGAIQLTYGHSQHEQGQGQQAPLARHLGGLQARCRAIGRRLRGRAPGMQMNAYPLNQVMFLLQASGVTRCLTEFTDHGGHLGLTIYFNKP